MKDLGENLFVLDAIRPVNAVAEYNARANGTLNTATQIDLADYNYPKEILVVVEVGAVGAGGKLDVSLKSGATAAAITTVVKAFTQITAVAATTVSVVTYHYIPTKRYCNIVAIVTTAAVDFGVTMVMGALGWGSSGQA